MIPQPRNGHAAKDFENFGRFVFSKQVCRGLLITSCLIPFGCRPNETATNPTNVVAETRLTEALETNVANQAASVSLQPASLAEVESYLNEQAGLIVVLDVWSMSCVPCKKEFPKLVALQAKYPDRVACVSLNVDYIGLKKRPADSYYDEAFGFLARQSAQFQNFLSTDTDEYVLDHLGIVSLPSVLIFDANGGRVAAVGEDTAGDDGFGYEQDVYPLVEALVNGVPDPK